MKQGMSETVLLSYEQVAAQLARSGDDTQSLFFKTFVSECKSWGTRHQVEMQLAAINQGLTDEEKSVLSMLAYKESKY